MSQLQYWFSSHVNTSPFQAKFLLNASRAILLLAALIIPFSNTRLHPYIPISQTSVWVGWLISGYCIIILLLSYLNAYVKRSLSLFVMLLFYLLMFALVQRVYFAAFEPEVNFLYLSISFLCCLYFNKKSRLLAFQLFSFGILVVAAALAPAAKESLWLVLGRYGVVHLLTFLVIGFRIDRGQKLRQQDIQYRSLFENLNEGVMFIGPLGRIQMVNDKMVDISGYERHELLSMYAGQLILLPEKEESSGENGQLTSLVVAKGTECRLQRKDESEIWVRFSSAPIRQQQQLLGYVGVCADITAEKNTEQTLRRYSEKLSLSNKELEQFSYFASHDLKAPIHTVASFARLLKQYYQQKKPVDAEARKAMSIMLKDAQRMHKLVDALQIYTRSGTEMVHKEQVDMNEVVKEACENLAGFIHTNDARLKVDELPFVEADKVQMVRLIQNLIENAIIYRKDHAPIIHISYSLNSSASRYIFSVEDNGVGIEAQDYEKIFGMFQKADSPQSQGLGVGLAVCKRIVENHQGKIWLKSVKGRGTTVYFSIPTREHKLLQHQSS